MYESLVNECESFHLYVFAFDDTTHNVLQQLRLPHLTSISLSEFEYEEMLSVKPNRSMAEYCWTSTPFTIKYCLEKIGLDHCIYVDADLYFYNPPQILLQDLEDASVLITPHNYSLQNDQSATAGIYCVQFLYFKNDFNGLRVLDIWANQCIGWCYARYEDGKFGDQKYLDCWPYTYDGIKICRHFGAGYAPWNVDRYQLNFSGKKFEIQEKENILPLIFYHFHYLKIYENGKKYLGQYPFNEQVIKHLYIPYFEALERAENLAKPYLNGADPHGKAKNPTLKTFTWRDKLYLYRKNIMKSAKELLVALSGKTTINEINESKKNYL
jgi:hypothetical protein